MLGSANPFGRLFDIRFDGYREGSGRVLFRLARTVGRSDAELSADRAGEAVIDLAMTGDGRAFPDGPIQRV
jgi:hypothetical protein